MNLQFRDKTESSGYGLITQKLFGRRRYNIIFIIVATLLTASLHYITTADHILHNIHTELHYIPLILAAIIFGLRGAIFTFILLTALYLPYFFSTWDDPALSIINRLVHMALSGLIACLAGFLVDREKKHRRQSERDQYLAGLGQATAAIVHDLQNPLISILGFARRIREGKGSTDEASAVVLTSAEKMQKIIHDMLDFAKPIRLELGNENINSILKNAVASCKIKAEDRQIKLISDLPAELDKIVIDGLQMERTLVNLINNAIEASGSGQSVSICATGDKDSIVVRIKDSGVGMDRETVENAFMPFFTRKPSGIGLGMAIAKKIVEEHQGTILINSKKTFGTEVMIVLPYMQKKI
jgi:signal transduction histidine kinase